MITEEKLLMLLQINEAVSDYLLALENDGFAAEFGGVGVFLEALQFAHYEWDEEFNTMTDEEMALECPEYSGELN